MVPESNSMEEELSFLRNLLASVHGIICPSDCFCHDPAILTLVREGRQIEPTVAQLTNQNRIEEALASGENLIAIHRRLNVSWASIGGMNYNLFCIAACKSDTLPRAMGYIRSAVELYRKICPYSKEFTKKYEELLERPGLHPNFKMMD